MTVEELAEATGLHPNTVREHLHRLIDSGFVSSRARRGATAGRPRLTYTTEVDRDDPIQAKKMRAATQRAEYTRWLLPTTTVAQEPTAISRQVDMLEDHFDQCGFDATVDVDSLQLKVHVCPFEKLARQNPEVCQAHFHLIDLVMHRVDGPLETDRLHRLDLVDGCSVDLRCHPVDAQSPARPFPDGADE